MKPLALLIALLGSTASAETLRIATGGHFPPYIFDPATPQAKGLDKDIVDELCLRGGYTCTWVDLPMSDIFQALARGDVDVVAGGFGYSSDRDALVDFTCPYVTGDSSTGLFVGARQDIDLINAHVGALDQSLYLDAMEQANRTVTAYPTEDAALDALVAGDIDVAFGSHNMLELAQNRGGLFELGEYPTFSGGTVLGVAETAPELLLNLNALLAEMSQDGTLGGFQRKWIGVDGDDTISRCLRPPGLT